MTECCKSGLHFTILYCIIIWTYSPLSYNWTYWCKKNCEAQMKRRKSVALNSHCLKKTPLSKTLLNPCFFMRSSLMTLCRIVFCPCYIILSGVMESWICVHCSSSFIPARRLVDESNALNDKQIRSVFYISEEGILAKLTTNGNGFVRKHKNMCLYLQTYFAHKCYLAFDVTCLTKHWNICLHSETFFAHKSCLVVCVTCLTNSELKGFQTCVC